MIFLLCLIVIPIVANIWGKKYHSTHTGLITGVSFGLIASPFSLGLYSLFYIPIIGIIGMIGLPFALLHGEPGFQIATILNLRQPNMVVSGIEHIYIEAINGIVWSIIYGFIGFTYDNLKTSINKIKAE